MLQVLSIQLWCKLFLSETLRRPLLLSGYYTDLEQVHCIKIRKVKAKSEFLICMSSLWLKILKPESQHNIQATSFCTMNKIKEHIFHVSLMKGFLSHSPVNYLLVCKKEDSFVLLSCKEFCDPNLGAWQWRVFLLGGQKTTYPPGQPAAQHYHPPDSQQHCTTTPHLSGQRSAT